MLLVGDFIPKNMGVRLPEEFRRQKVLANLEGPICACGLSQSNKVGVCLHTSRELFDSSECSIVRLEGGGEAPRFAFSLANNHMMDFREEGLRQTKEVLDAHGIPYSGAGENEEDARKPMFLEENGKRIAIFSCCERQFGMATKDKAGCAAKGPWLYTAIQNVKSSRQADYVIVSCHAASEYSPWVSPSLHEFYHSLIDAGADCIHGHHAHVPQGYEEYKGKPIFYGLGNFVVKVSDWGSYRHYLWSMVATVDFAEKVSWKVVPYSVKEDVSEIVLAPCGDVEVTEYIKLVNVSFSDRVLLEGCWQAASCRLFPRLYAQSLRMPSVMASRLSIRDRVRKVYFAIGDLVRAVWGYEKITAKSLHYGKVYYNMFNCESHVEMIQTALGVSTGILDDYRTQTVLEMTERLMKGF